MIYPLVLLYISHPEHAVFISIYKIFGTLAKMILLNLYDPIRLLEPLSNDILVFGSNTQGRHGKGSALLAKEKFEAIYGKAMGPQGRSYAICTKDLTVKKHPSISQKHIINQIRELYKYAAENKSSNFLIVYSGEGENLNAYSHNEMANMFLTAEFDIPQNILFQKSFAKYMTS